MKRKERLLLSAAAALAFALPVSAALADSGPYLEAGYAWPTITRPNTASITPGEFVAHAGYEFSSYVGAELFGATTIQSADLGGAAVRLENGVGAYLTGRIEPAPNFELLAKAGWVHATLSANRPGVSVWGSDSSFSYGAGARFRATWHWYVQADYVSYYDKNGDAVRGPSVGVGYRF